MRIAAAGCVLASLAAFPALFADSSYPDQNLFSRLRSRVLDSLGRAPRYTCVETVTRMHFRPRYVVRPANCAGLISERATLTSAGVLVWRDRLRLDVAVDKDAEMFSWAGAGRFETGEIETLTSMGAMGSGAFNSFLTSVFGSDAEQFRYAGERETDLGRLAAYEYAVPFAKSHYSYRTHSGSGWMIPYDGSFYVEPATGELKRLIVDAREFAGGDVCRVIDTLDYETVRVGPGKFLLPSISKMVVLYRNGEEAQNETHFSSCHEFAGQSTIRFDDAEEPNSPPSLASAGLRPLPPRTRIRVGIDSPIHSETAAAGDPISASVEHEARDRRSAIVGAGDRLHGRILRLEQFMVPDPHWVVAIRFDTIERDGVEQPISLRPVDDGNRPAAIERLVGWRIRPAAVRAFLPERPDGAGVFVFRGAGNLTLDGRFHSAWETR